MLLVTGADFGSWQSRRFGNAGSTSISPGSLPFTPAGLERALRAAGFEHPEVTTSTTADGLQLSLQYRFFGRRRFRSGVSLYLTVALSLALLPLTEVANALGGGGDQLGASAARPDAG